MAEAQTYFNIVSTNENMQQTWDILNRQINYINQRLTEDNIERKISTTNLCEENWTKGRIIINLYGRQECMLNAFSNVMFTHNKHCKQFYSTYAYEINSNYPDDIKKYEDLEYMYKTLLSLTIEYVDDKIKRTINRYLGEYSQYIKQNKDETNRLLHSCPNTLAEAFQLYNDLYDYRIAKCDFYKSNDMDV